MESADIFQEEFSATEIRKILQRLFPHRRLVLSQFTFFNHSGVVKATGKTFRRGRRCYRLFDLLSIATVLALKEEGIPLKNISSVPELVQAMAEQIFSCGVGTRISGFGAKVQLTFPGEIAQNVIDAFLSGGAESVIFWGFDVGVLATQLLSVASSQESEGEGTGQQFVPSFQHAA